jgi:hypothetical protein
MYLSDILTILLSTASSGGSLNAGIRICLRLQGVCSEEG